jgi:hypothetical protein
MQDGRIRSGGARTHAPVGTPNVAAAYEEECLAAQAENALLRERAFGMRSLLEVPAYKVLGDAETNVGFCDDAHGPCACIGR